MTKTRHDSTIRQEWYTETNSHQLHIDTILITPQEQVDWDRQKEMQQKLYNSSKSQFLIINDRISQDTANISSARAETHTSQGDTSNVTYDPQRSDVIVIMRQQQVHPENRSDAQVASNCPRQRPEIMPSRVQTVVERQIEQSQNLQQSQQANVILYLATTP
jgi:hypothetical protein